MKSFAEKELRKLRTQCYTYVNNIRNNNILHFDADLRIDRLHKRFGQSILSGEIAKFKDTYNPENDTRRRYAK